MKIEISKDFPTPSKITRASKWTLVREMFMKLKSGESMLLVDDKSDRTPSQWATVIRMGPFRSMVGQYVGRSAPEGFRVWKKEPETKKAK